MGRSAIRARWLPILVTGAALWHPACDVMPGRATERRYAGRPLTAQVFQCRSDQVAAAGYWSDASGVKESASVSRQSSTTTWRVRLKGAIAEVTAYTGATNMIEDPQIFSVEQTSGGLLLIYRDRSPGTSHQVITIDAGNSSFVYSSQHVSPMYNRANVFFGTCVAGP